jgi:acyl-CoA synthetase (AMP-forming)/AMP-acid ligase II/thioesterase domain-containing protein
MPHGQIVEVTLDGRQRTARHDEMYRQAVSLARHLVGLDVVSTPILRPTPGPTLILCFQSVLEFVPAVWAAIIGNLSHIPVQIFSAARAAEELAARLPHLKERLDPALIVTSESLKRLILAEGDLWCAKKIVSLDEPDACPAGSAPDLGEIGAAGSGKLLLGTSGTTDQPKIACIGLETLLRRYFANHALMSRYSSLNASPFDGTTGHSVMYPSHPCRVYMHPSRAMNVPADLLAAIGKHQIQLISASTSLAAKICDTVENSDSQFDLSSIKHVAMGSEMIVPAVVQRLVDNLERSGASGYTMTFSYGSTENGGISRTRDMSAPEALRHLEASPTAVSLGRCRPGCALRIVDDGDLPLTAGSVGNIQIRSPQKIFDGYLGVSGLDRSSFVGDGWFRTGDLGLIEDGELKITGRKKSTIIIKGQNISLEQIEGALRQIEDVGDIVACAVRRPEALTDELAIFLVPLEAAAARVDDLCQEIAREVTQSTSPPDATDIEIWLAGLWKSFLKLDADPRPDENFFDLGGDSLAAAEMLFSVEERYRVRLPLPTFFDAPTLTTLAGLVTSPVPAAPAVQMPASARQQPTDIVRTLERLAGSWRGARKFREAMIVGHNTAGSRPPLFWVFQTDYELAQLARYLGPDQPLYGMRSLDHIVAPMDYAPEHLTPVCDRYLWEILALGVPEPISIGGNCQGAIIALTLAQRLARIGRPPAALILMEWSYSHGSYDGPTLILYGDESYTAKYYRDELEFGPRWRQDFRQAEVAAISGPHGQFFDEPQVREIAGILGEYLGSRVPQSPRSPATGTRRFRLPWIGKKLGA